MSALALADLHGAGAEADLPQRIAEQRAHLAFHRMAAARCRHLGMGRNAERHDAHAEAVVLEVAREREARQAVERRAVVVG